MTRTSPAAHVTKRAILHTVAPTRTRHAGNVGRLGRESRYPGGINETAPEVALTNFQGLTHHLYERQGELLLSMVHARSDSQREARD